MPMRMRILSRYLLETAWLNRQNEAREQNTLSLLTSIRKQGEVGTFDVRQIGIGIPACSAILSFPSSASM